MAQSKRQRSFGIHPSVAHGQNIVRKLEENTGRDLKAWTDLLEAEQPAEKAARVAWLKTEHKIGGVTANLVATLSLGEGKESIDATAYRKAAAGYVDAMFSGGKSALRPIYEALLELSYSLGSDVKACPCKTIVPLYREHVFAEIKPSTRTRVDLGLALGAAKGKVPQRLIDTGGAAKKDRITHRIALSRPDEVDAFVERWLQKAYDLDG